MSSRRSGDHATTQGTHNVAFANDVEVLGDTGHGSGHGGDHSEEVHPVGARRANENKSLAKTGHVCDPCFPHRGPALTPDPRNRISWDASLFPFHHIHESVANAVRKSASGKWT